MTRPYLPLNALRAFEASARHLSLTRAAEELSVTQAAISHQIKSLEDRLGVQLFRRLPRGLVLTDEGQPMVPVLQDAFERIGKLLDRVSGGHVREVLTVGVVGTFAVGWLIPRLDDFRTAHPSVEVRLLTNNNAVDLAADGLDYAIRFGDGAWHATDAVEIMSCELAPLCAPRLQEKIAAPEDFLSQTLLRSYRSDEWPAWFRAADLHAPPISGPVFDSSVLMVQAAIQECGIALVPLNMFQRELAEGRLVQASPVTISVGSYWLTRLKSKVETPAMTTFRSWLIAPGSPGLANRDQNGS